MELMNAPAKFEVRTYFTRSCRAIEVWVHFAKLRTPNHGEEEAVGGRGRYHSKERWWVPVGLPYNFSSICACFRDIAAAFCG